MNLDINVFVLSHYFSDDSKGKRQRKILYKTQNYLNLYAADGLRTLCIAKKVTLSTVNNSMGTIRGPLHLTLIKLFPCYGRNEKT